MTDPLRFLLDQNFPEVGLVDPHAVDLSVRYEHIRVWKPELVADTPDWLIYFEAELADFTGLVTKDWRQSVQAEEAFALTHTKLTVVTWREAPDDPIVEWAMLTAYMPEIKGILAGRRTPPVIFLPSPRLTDRDNTQRRDHALGLAARARGISTAQATREAQASIIDHLTQEGLRPELRGTRGAQEHSQSAGLPPSPTEAFARTASSTRPGAAPYRVTAGGHDLVAPLRFDNLKVTRSPSPVVAGMTMAVPHPLVSIVAVRTRRRNVRPPRSPGGLLDRLWLRAVIRAVKAAPRAAFGWP